MTFYFYDLETSGFSPRDARIMQFAGQRVDMQLQPIGEPHNYLVKLTDDVLPDPDAVLLTGITPQATIAEGISEAEFLKLFTEQIATENTIFVGFNNIRFDDEFMRFLHYRNFYDAYEWQWREARSRWDMLDVVRMTRALRPEGIEWPVDSKGLSVNKLTSLTGSNGLDHANAHDALGDVRATIALAQLLRQKQPKLFDYLLKSRDKNIVSELVQTGQPFIYTSGKYPSEFEKTTTVVRIADHPQAGGCLVYDLRHDPTPFLSLSPDKIVEVWKYDKEAKQPRLPVKTLKYNRCPAVAPLSVLDSASQKRLGLSLETIQTNLQKLQNATGFASRVLKALDLLDKHQQATFLSATTEVDAQLYDGFFANADKQQMNIVRSATASQLIDLSLSFQDSRLNALLPLYKARNFPKTMSDKERTAWEQFRQRKLVGSKAASKAAQYFARLVELSAQPSLTKNQHYLLKELQLYGQSILAAEN